MRSCAVVDTYSQVPTTSKPSLLADQWDTGDNVSIPAVALRKRTGFLFPSAHKTPARFPASVNWAHTAPPPLPPSAAPAGITHYTLQARSCAKGEHKPPLETPDFVGVWPRIAFLHLCPYPIQNPKKRRRLAHEWWAGLRRFFIRPVGRDGGNRIEKILLPS